jgi:RimJ/RimL family protein N-acetyltransferase
MSWQVVPIERRHIPGFREVLDGVARERRWLALLEAPPPSSVRRFVLGNLRTGSPQFVALDGERVVGWCDVTRKSHSTLAHSGTLGMGIAPSHRGKGIGRALLVTTVEAALDRGFSRIELTVRADNEAAIRLYYRHGFELEGRLRDYLVIDDRAYDVLQMARFGT